MMEGASGGGRGDGIINSNRRSPGVVLGATRRTNGLGIGSIWETRMKLDEMKGGIKVFNGKGDDGDGGGAAAAVAEEEEDDGLLLRVYTRRLRNRPNQNDLTAAATAAAAGEKKKKRRNWKEEEEVDIVVGRDSFDDKEVDLLGETNKERGNDDEEEKRVHQIRQVPISSIFSDRKMPATVNSAVVKSSPSTVMNFPDLAEKLSPTRREIYADLAKTHDRITGPELTKASREVAEEFYECIPGTQHRMQSIVDLVMWRDIARSAFVFGIGIFILLFSSYTNDLNFSFISAISCLGLVYLAAVFLYKSFICRGVVEYEETDRNCMVGEDEAIWLLKLLLPYLNEVLVKVRALFSGDPATTVKLAVLLFVLARWGGALTTLTLVKLAFVGGFTIPRIYSAYSVQLARYGKFWMDRVRDAWESCQHKKPVATVVFTLVWNVSSTITRIWAVFILFVAVVRWYQQRSAAAAEWEETEEEEVNQQHQRGPPPPPGSEKPAVAGGGAVVQKVGLGGGRRRHNGGNGGGGTKTQPWDGDDNKAEEIVLKKVRRGKNDGLWTG